MNRLRISLLVLLCLSLTAQAPDRSSKSGQGSTVSRSTDERLAVIESQLASVQKINDRLDKLQDKINDLSIQLSALNTKMDIVVWVGTAIGALLIAQLFGFLKVGQEGRDRFALFDKLYPPKRPRLQKSDAQLVELIERYLERREIEQGEQPRPGKKQPTVPRLPEE